MRKETQWEALKREKPGHSAWYIQRFATMRREGADLDGEARMIDAMAGRGSRILDAGSGTGRIGGELARRGHAVVGVDVDPELTAAARADFPGTPWITADLAELDLSVEGVSDGRANGTSSGTAESQEEPFALIVCAGNVMGFLAPGTAPEVLRRFALHLAPEGRAVIGFGAGRGYGFEEFFDDARSAGFKVDARFATWDLRPFTPSSDFLVTVLSKA